MDYPASRGRHSSRTWLLLPGTAVALFAIASIVLPIGSAQVGAVDYSRPGLAPSLARFAQDIHDGFWSRRAMAIDFVCPTFTADSEGLLYAQRGEAREAIAAFQETGLRSEQDRWALYDLLDRLIVDGKFDLAEWYVREADILLSGGGLRNNLAWHYTQVDMRPETALALALSSVTAEREAFNVDTLAWAYYRNGDLVHAIGAARQTLDFHRTWMSGENYDDVQSKESSRKLLAILSERQPEQSSVPVPSVPRGPGPERDPFSAR